MVRIFSDRSSPASGSAERPLLDVESANLLDEDVLEGRVADLEAKDLSVGQGSPSTACGLAPASTRTSVKSRPGRMTVT